MLGRAVQRLAALDAELLEAFADRASLGPAFGVIVEGWYVAMTRELTRLEFPAAEIDELLTARVRGLARDTRFTGCLRI